MPTTVVIHGEEIANPHVRVRFHEAEPERGHGHTVKIHKEGTLHVLNDSLQTRVVIHDEPEPGKLGDPMNTQVRIDLPNSRAKVDLQLPAGIAPPPALAAEQMQAELDQLGRERKAIENKSRELSRALREMTRGPKVADAPGEPPIEVVAELVQAHEPDAHD